MKGYERSMCLSCLKISYANTFTIYVMFVCFSLSFKLSFKFNDKLTYLHDLNATRKLRVSFLICNLVRFYTIIDC